MVRPDDPIYVEPAALSEARKRFEDLSQQFLNTKEPLRTCHDQVIGGAGEFSNDVATGVTGFLLSWQSAFDVSSSSAGLIAGNIDTTVVELTWADRDASIAIEL